MWIFCFLLWTAVRASEEPLYKKIGDKVVLSPGYVKYHIYNIRWMYGNDVAMWYRYGGETLFFGRFEDRGSLNISTGVMTITGLTRNDSGNYTPEINNKVNSKTELQVISPVPKPTIYKSCEKTYCVLTCHGSITGAEPVTYWWTAGEKRWSSIKELKITKEEKKGWFSCELKNPVSSRSSEKVFNSFIESDSIESDWTWIYSLMGVYGVFLLVFIIVVFYLICKCIKGRVAIRKLEENAANRKLEERGVMLSDVENTSHQDPTSGFKPKWQYGGNGRGEWWDFRETTDPPNDCSVTSDDIERWYQEKPHSKMDFTVDRFTYELDFSKMIQTNQSTHKIRKVRRVMVSS